MTMNRTRLAPFAAVLSLLAAGTASAAGPQLDPGLTAYAKVEALRGTLNAAGSDTMLELQTLMAEDFRKLYPQVKIQVEGKGSSTAPPALIEGTVQLGNMSRAMKNQRSTPSRRSSATRRSADVAPDTPRGLRQQGQPDRARLLPQVDAVFSKTRQVRPRRRPLDLGQLGAAWQLGTA
jgi:phosphate transport system substrate-binding protein